MCNIMMKFFKPTQKLGERFCVKINIQDPHQRYMIGANRKHLLIGTLSLSKQTKLVREIHGSCNHIHVLPSSATYTNTRLENYLIQLILQKNISIKIFAFLGIYDIFSLIMWHRQYCFLEYSLMTLRHFFLLIF